MDKEGDAGGFSHDVFVILPTLFSIIRRIIERYIAKTSHIGAYVYQHIWMIIRPMLIIKSPQPTLSFRNIYFKKN